MPVGGWIHNLHWVQYDVDIYVAVVCINYTILTRQEDISHKSATNESANVNVG